ncbi:glucan 1-3-beta-glucosidase [Apiospora saccharicola]|uniref:Glucan 1-3-beta-glucosidase n=1 Tax=Apiospora saccharicola TaxID=335842 RepID=A0ABR1UK63_9PEZI
MAFNRVLAALLLVLVQQYSLVAASWEGIGASSEKWPNVPGYGPQPNAPYMVDNRNNFFNASPDKGTQDGPVWKYSGSFENFMTNLHAGHVIRGGDGSGMKPSGNATSSSRSSTHEGLTHSRRSDSSYWLTKLGPLGTQPHAGSGYKFFRNVVDDYKADNSGKTDTVESINAAIQDGDRCGKDCGNTFTKGAIIYFPPGTYKICTPIIQLYYTQFIGDPNDPPIIKGCDTFKGIAMIDTDPYIPGTSGEQWYVNENQFFRHIRNFVFDLTDMPLSTTDDSQPYVPTGIHWQAAQATTLQNLVFSMPNATDASTATHVGIFMENGSGGFVSGRFSSAVPSDGEQQYTARNIKFYGCLTSVQMVWDWGFNWQGVEIHGGAVGFNISGRGGDKGQGTGSVSIIDCTIINVPTAILTNGLENAPNIVLDNLWVENVVDVVVQDDNKRVLYVGILPQRIELWAAGQRYNGSEGSYKAAPAEAPPRGAGLIEGEREHLFVRSRPEYHDLDSSSFLVATNEGISNDGSGDQAGAINAFLDKAASANQIAYFPAGIYQVASTILIPTGSRVQGSSWSQIQGAGFYFADMHNPKVMVQVGNKGDVGNMEIVEMLFTVAGPTAGAVLMEWNVAAAHQGSAAMWDSHFRVGGATGTDLDVEHCPKTGGNERQCIAASLMFHATPQASGYFENVWAWVADHDNDFNTVNVTDKSSNQVRVYGARGMLIESEGPSWFYGSGSEHSVLYNYQFSNAKNIYIGHLQTEAPYFQPEPLAPHPFTPGKSFASDPTFDDCTTDACRTSWGMRILDSKNITVHGAGLYSFFQNFQQNCTNAHNCQESILEVQNSHDVAIFNIFTVGTENVALGINDTAIRQNDTQSGYTTEVSIWLPNNGQDSPNIVYVGTEIWATPSVSCSPPCILVLPTSPLSTSSTIDPGNYTTSLEYGSPGTTTLGDGQVITTFIITTTIVTIDIPLLTIGAMPFYNLNVTSTATAGGFLAEPSVDIPPVGVPLPNGKGGTTTRSLTLPPWPKVSEGPPDGPGWVLPSDPFDSSLQFPRPPSSPGSLPSTPTSPSTRSMTFFTPYRTSLSVAGPTTLTINFPETPFPETTIQVPPVTELPFQTPKWTLTLPPDLNTAFTLRWHCHGPFFLTFFHSFTGFYDFDCIFRTAWTWPLTPEPTATADPLSLHPATITFPGGAGGAQPTSFTLNGYGGGEEPISLTFGAPHWSIPPLHVTFGGGDDTTVTPWTFPGTLTFSGGGAGAQPTILTIGQVGGGAPPETLMIGGASGQSTSVVFGGYWPWLGAPATTLTLDHEYDHTTITLGGGLGKPEITTMTIYSHDEFVPVPTPITLMEGGGAEPTTIVLTQPTTVTFGGGRWSWGAFDTDQAAEWTIPPAAPQTSSSGPPPPGLLKFPGTGDFKVRGKLPPFPKITIGWDHKLTYDDPRSTACETQTADLCEITTSVFIQSGTTSRSTITGDCAPIEGCAAVCLNDAMVYPKDSDNVGEIPDLLVNYTGKYEVMGAGSEVGFYWVPALDRDTYELLLESPDVAGVQYYEEENVADPYHDETDDLFPVSGSEISANSTGNSSTPHMGSLARRYGIEWANNLWQTGIWSLPKKQDLCSPTSWSCDYNAVPPSYRYWYDNEGGFDVDHNRGWTVYVVNEWAGPWTSHMEFAYSEIEYLRNSIHYRNPQIAPNKKDTGHPSFVISQINGQQLGTCKRCRVVYTWMDDFTNWPSNEPQYNVLGELWMIYDDVLTNNLQNKAVVNWSGGYRDIKIKPVLMEAIARIFRKLDAIGVVLVCSAGNHARKEGKGVRAYPARFGDPDTRRNPEGEIPNLIVVGATTKQGTDTDWGQTAPYLTTFAPGEDVTVPRNPAEAKRNDKYTTDSGTSMAAPQVAGIIAYMRSLPGPFHVPLKDPKNVKKMVKFLARRYDTMLPDNSILPIDPWDKRPVVWNGQVTFRDATTDSTKSYSCLKDWDTRLAWDFNGACNGLDPDMDKMGNGEPVVGCPSKKSHRQQLDAGGDADSCPFEPLHPGAQPLTFSSASVAQPTCAAAGGCGGTVCSGYYCAASPAGPPPDHQDPKDPDNGHPVPSSTVTRSWSTEPAAPTDLNSWSTDLYTTTTTSSSTKTTAKAPSPTPTCDDRCKLDKGNPCNCNEHGCDDNSPACCVNTSCPDCYCSDTGCDLNSPKCCETNTCAWSWTGGGGGEKRAASSGQLSDRLAALSNSTSPMYGLWSHTNDSNGAWHIAGYNGRMKPERICTETPAWSTINNNNKNPGAAGILQTWYANLTAFDDTCSYLAGVDNYTSVVAGAKVGALTCRRWATADCYRANSTDVHDCGTDKVAEELVCQW